MQNNSNISTLLFQEFYCHRRLPLYVTFEKISKLIDKKRKQNSDQIFPE